MEVVEQPLGGGRRRLSAPGVVGERGVDLAQRAHVLVEPPQMRAAAAARPPRERQERREPPGVLLERLDPEQFDAAACQ